MYLLKILYAGNLYSVGVKSEGVRRVGEVGQKSGCVREDENREWYVGVWSVWGRLGEEAISQENDVE